MHRRSALAIGLLSLAALTGCASGAGASGAVSPHATGESVAGSEGADVAAQEQAQAWLDSAALPPGATRSPGSTAPFNSYQGWPCRPVAELKAYWTIPDSSVAETANWLMANPTADLVSTAVGPVPENATIGSTIVGYIPADGSQQGVVYTVAKTGDGVAVRAEIAALTATAVCPSLPPGESLGNPGQG